MHIRNFRKDWFGQRSFLGLGSSCAFLAGLVIAGPLWAGVAWAEDQTSDPIRIVAYGDSLVAGFGLKPTDAFPAQLQQALNGQGGGQVKVVNGGVSGDTTSSGLERFDWVIRDGTDAVILELGANDTLRGIDPRVTRKNLDEILRRLGERKIPVLLAGMRAARNWGNDHVEEFETIYVDLAKKYDAILYPFFLADVALNPKLNLRDGLHPNAKGVAVIVEKILPHVRALLERARVQRAAAN